MALFRRKRKTNRRVERPRKSGKGTGRRIAKGILVLAAIAAAAGGLPLAGWYGYRAVLESGYFAPKNVVVTGNVRVSEAEILGAAGLDADDANLIDLEQDVVATRVEALPWIKSASVETQLPDYVAIEVEEREMLGIVRDEGLHVVDVEGRPIVAWSGDIDVEAPVVSGHGLTGDAARARELVLMGFEVAGLYEAMELDRWAELSEVHYDAQIGFTLFAHETEIRIGRDRFHERLQRLWQVFVLLEERGTRPEYVLLDLEKNIDRVAVKPWPRVVAAQSAEDEGDGEDGVEESDDDAGTDDAVAEDDEQ